jgi:hypothetical protein
MIYICSVITTYCGYDNPYSRDNERILKMETDIEENKKQLKI